VNIKDFYESEAGVRGAVISGRAKKAANMFTRHLGTARRLLDVGRGVGGVTVFLRDILKAEEVYGIEISEKRIEAARQRGVEAIQHDLNTGSLPFGDDYFDAIFCSEIIEHLIDPDHLLDEVCRVLAPQGVCVLTTPNLAVWYNRLTSLLGWQPFNTSVGFRHKVGRPKFLASVGTYPSHLRVFSCRALKEIIFLHQFQVLEVRGINLSDVFVGKRDWSKKPLSELLY
jgi:methionine biosynthesis protein MetW